MHLTSILTLFLAFVVCKRNIPGYDGETSNYGDIHRSVKKFKTERKIQETQDNKDPDEDIFYFFTLHDYNKDHYLDGHELGLAFQGYEFYKNEEFDFENEVKREDLEFMIDHALLEDDKDNDGKISWKEYLESAYFHHNLKTE